MTDDPAMTPPPKPGRGKLRRNPATFDLTAAPAPRPDTDPVPGRDDRVSDAPDDDERPSSLPDVSAATDARPPVTAEAVTPEPARPADLGQGSDGFTGRADEDRAKGRSHMDDAKDDSADRSRAVTPDLPPSGTAPAPAEAGPSSPSAPPRATTSAAVSVPALALAAVSGAIAGGLVSFLLMPTSTPIDETATRLVALERRVAALPAPLPQGEVTALAGRLNGLAEQVAGLGREVAAASGKADAAASRAAALENAPPASAQPAVRPEALAAQEQRLDALEATLGRLDPTRLAAASADASTRAGRVATLAAQALVAEDLIGRIRRGEPFSRSIDRLVELGVPNQKLAALRQGAAAGLPSLSALRTGFAGLADRLAEPPEQAPPEDFTSRALASINRLVRIRAVGANAVTEQVAAVDAALARGDAPAALTAWQALPDNARKASAAWGAELERLVAVETAAQTLSGEIVTALAGEAANTPTGARP